MYRRCVVFGKIWQKVYALCTFFLSFVDSFVKRTDRGGEHKKAV